MYKLRTEAVSALEQIAEQVLLPARDARCAFTCVRATRAHSRRVRVVHCTRGRGARALQLLVSSVEDLGGAV